MPGSAFDESALFGAISGSGARALPIGRRALIRWFRRRYPTAKDRLAYVRRAYAQQSRSFPSRAAGGGEPSR